MKTTMRPSTPKTKNDKGLDEAPIKFSTPSTKPNNLNSPQKTPKVDIQKLFQQNPNLFLKEDLGKNIDNVLSRAYDNVLTKKNEKEDLDIKQEILLKEIKSIEKETVPLIMKNKKNNYKL